MSRRFGPNATLDSQSRRPADYRLVSLAIALWSGVLAGLALSWPATVVTLSASVVAAFVTRRASLGVRRTVLVLVLCLLAGLALGVLRAQPVRHGPIAELAGESGNVVAEAEVAADPKPRDGYVVGRLRLTEVTAGDNVYHVRALVILVADPSWGTVLPGQQVRVAGRLEPPRDAGRASAVLMASEPPVLVDARPGPAAQLTEPLRAGLREAASTVEGDGRGLIPAMLVGDESLMTDALRDDMRRSGLAHLTAVSGMNVTIVLVMVLGVARWVGVRGYILHVLGVLAIIGFVALARPDPSVVRAAAMGAIAIGGLVFAGHRRGLRTLAAAVIVLLLIDPWLAKSAGFALSVVATGAILLLSPAWQRAALWLPKPVATAVTVPLAAQAACLPILVSISGIASVVSVPANILAAPAVAPITVLSATVALTAPITSGVAAVLAWLAAWPARWISAIASWCADLPGATLAWPSGGAGVVLALVVSGVLVVATPFVLRRKGLAAVAAVALATVPWFHPTRLPNAGWPPTSWALLVCDVGQGDALALRVSERAAVVVDAGPDPEPVRRCLDDMNIERVPMLVLTHFDSDHVGGLAGVLNGREVARALVSPVNEPTDNAQAVRSQLGDAGVPVDVATAGLRQRIGPDVRYEVVWPRRRTSSGSPSNNASVVLRASVSRVTMLLTGDIEPQAQIGVRARLGEERINVLKVPHHGSPAQDREFLTDTGAEVAVVSVGENDYGHPSRRVLDELRTAGTVVVRSDQRGTFAIVRDDSGELAIAHR